MPIPGEPSEPRNPHASHERTGSFVPQPINEQRIDFVPPKYRDHASTLLQAFVDFQDELTDNPELGGVYFTINQDLKPREFFRGLEIENRGGAFFLDLIKPNRNQVAQISYAGGNLVQEALQGDVDLVPQNVLLRAGVVILEPDSPRFRINVWGTVDKKEAEQVADTFIPGIEGVFPSLLEINATGKNPLEIAGRLRALLEFTTPYVLERNDKI